MKQTAVEFLKGELDKFVRCEFGDDPYTRYTLKDLYNAFEQAKAMEKEQIKKSYLIGFLEEKKDFSAYHYYEDLSEQYYNETFKSE